MRLSEPIKKKKKKLLRPGLHFSQCTKKGKVVSGFLLKDILSNARSILRLNSWPELEKTVNSDTHRKQRCLRFKDTEGE